MHGYLRGYESRYEDIALHVESPRQVDFFHVDCRSETDRRRFDCPDPVGPHISYHVKAKILRGQARELARPFPSLRQRDFEFPLSKHEYRTRSGNFSVPRPLSLSRLLKRRKKIREEGVAGWHGFSRETQETGEASGVLARDSDARPGGREGRAGGESLFLIDKNPSSLVVGDPIKERRGEVFRFPPSCNNTRALSLANSAKDHPRFQPERGTPAATRPRRWIAEATEARGGPVRARLPGHGAGGYASQKALIAA